MMEFQPAEVARIEEMVSEAIAKSNLRRSQKFVLRLRYAISPKFRAVLNDAIEEKYLDENPSATEIDWDKFADFLERILPLILQLIIGLM
jgi:hypothetical protein